MTFWTTPDGGDVFVEVSGRCGDGSAGSGVLGTLGILGPPGTPGPLGEVGTLGVPGTLGAFGVGALGVVGAVCGGGNGAEESPEVPGIRFNGLGSVVPAAPESTFSTGVAEASIPSVFKAGSTSRKPWP